MNFKVIDDAGGNGLQTRRFFAAGECVVELEGRWVSKPSKYTIQLGVDRHLEPTDHLWALINHSCAPNLRVDCNRRVMVALRDIAAGESLSFDYLSTEWDMAVPFQCLCQSESCFTTIAGSRYLPERVRWKNLVWADEDEPSLLQTA